MKHAKRSLLLLTTLLVTMLLLLAVLVTSMLLSRQSNLSQKAEILSLQLSVENLTAEVNILKESNTALTQENFNLKISNEI